MKRIALILLLCLMLAGCQSKPAVTQPAQPPELETTIPETTTPETTIPETTEPETTIPETTEPETTIPETTEPETTVPETTVPAETEPEHSDLYLYYIPVEDVINWFDEVVLDTEFSSGGDATLVQKWETPILYTIHGDATPEDLAVLESFAASLNYIEGFPGIYPAEDMNASNLHIHFTDQQEFLDIMGQQYSGLDGAVTFWYDGDNRIYDEVICIRTDIDQYVRNSVILEEIYNGLGPVQDTILRPDSIIYQEYSEVQDLTLVDWLILRLLYHPDMLCGMDAAQCEAVIRDLYY